MKTTDPMKTENPQGEGQLATGAKTGRRVDVTPEAVEVMEQLKERFGPLMFHQSGGCCDGSSPMCFEEGDFKVGESDVWLGRINEADFWMSADQFEYWKHTHLTVDVVKGRGSSFSLEIPMGVRFVIRSRLFTDEEFAELQDTRRGEGVY